MGHFLPRYGLGFGRMAGRQWSEHAAEAILNANDYSLILHSWLRVPLADVRMAFSAMRAGGLMPRQRAPLAPSEAAAGLVGCMVLSMDGGRGWQGRAVAACGMSLEGDRDRDPLDSMSREVFCRAVGATLGVRSSNGYLNFVESIGQAMLRHRECVGHAELDRVAVCIGGVEPQGVVEIRDAEGAPHPFRFAPGGVPADRSGLQREVWVGRDVLAGVAYVLLADAARSSA